MPTYTLDTEELVFGISGNLHCKTICQVDPGGAGAQHGEWTGCDLGFGRGYTPITLEVWPSMNYYTVFKDYYESDHVVLSWNYSLKALTSVLASGKVDVTIADGDLEYHWPWYYIGEKDLTCVFSVAITVPLTVDLEITDECAPVQKHIYCGHQNYDPDSYYPQSGAASFELEAGEYPSLVVSVAGSEIYNDTVTETDAGTNRATWEADWENPGAVDGKLWVDYITDDRPLYMSAIGRLAGYCGLCADMTVNRSIQPPDYGSKTFTKEMYPVSPVYVPLVVMDGSKITFYENTSDYASTALVYNEVEIIDTCGEHTVIYAANQGHLSGELLSTDANFAVTIPEPGTDGDGRPYTYSHAVSFDADNELANTYAGVWTLYMAIDKTVDQDLAGPGALHVSTDASYYHWTSASNCYCKSDGNVLIDNLAAMGEPDFAAEGVPPASPAYQDDRVMIETDLPNTGWTALAFSIPTNPLTVITFDGDADEQARWTPTNCSFTIGTYLKVIASADDASIERLYDVDDATPDPYGDVTFQGARFIELEYASDDAAAITVSIAGREYTLTPGVNEIDLLHVENETGYDVTKSIIPSLLPNTPTIYGTMSEADVSWGWGVYRPRTVKFSGLRNGKYYEFKAVKLKKKAAVDGGSFFVAVAPEGNWYGTAVGDNEDPDIDGDDFAVEYAGQVTVGSVVTKAWYQRVGFVIVDGIVAGEIIGCKYTKVATAAVPITWSIDQGVLDDAEEDSLFPPCATGFISVVSSGDDGDFCDEDRATFYLNDGIHVASGSPETAQVSATLKLTAIEYPLIYNENRTATCRKRFRGVGLLRIAAEIGETYPVDVDGTDVDESIETDKLGVVWTPALKNGATYTINAFITTSESDTLKYSDADDWLLYNLSCGRLARTCFGAEEFSLITRNRLYAFLTGKATD